MKRNSVTQQARSWTTGRGLGILPVILLLSTAACAQGQARSASNDPVDSRPSTVERWDVYEAALAASGAYANPFRDVDLTATFTHASSGTSITVDGFYEGDSQWRVRFMPTQPGTWTWVAKSRDAGLNGQAGAIECVPPKKSYLHGPLMTDGFHFKHADGSRRFLISSRLSCQFDDPGNWDALVDYLKAHKINRVFFMLVANAQDRKAQFGRVLYGRDFDDRDASRFHLDVWRRIDDFIEKLRVNDIIASPYFYYFNDGFQRTLTPEQDELFIRYGMARFGSFGNVMPVLGNQIEHKTQLKTDDGYDIDYTWQNEKGRLLKQLAVYGQAVTVHNPDEGRSVNPSFWTALFANPFSFADCILKQAQVAAFGDVKTMDGATPEFDDDDGDGRPECSAAKDLNERAFARNNQYCIDMRNLYGIPIINEEPGYDFEVDEGYAWNAQNHNTIRATFWTAAMGGGYAAWGSKATYANGADRAYPQMVGNHTKAWGRHWSADPLTAMKMTPTAPYLKVLHDLMAAMPYWEMTPDNSIVSGPGRNVEGEEFRTAFCLKQDDVRYVVYALAGGKIAMDLPQGDWRVKRIDPRDGSTTDLGVRSGGRITVDLPESHPADFRQHTGDWVLSYERTPPSGSAWRVLPFITDGRIDAAWAQVGWGGFVVDGDALRTECDERGMGLLFYTLEKFGDCQVRIVYRCEKPKSNAGVFVRMDDGVLAKVGEKSPEVHRDSNGKLSPAMIERLKKASETHLGGWYPVHHGYEVQILDDGDAWHRTGAIYSLAKADPVPEKPPAEWRTMIITLDGEHITVDVDGKRLSSFDATADNPPRKNWTEPIRELKRPTHGYMGLQNHDPGDVVWFKEVSVRSLDRDE